VFFLGFINISGFSRAKNIFIATGMMAIQTFLWVPPYAFGKADPAAFKRNIHMPWLLQASVPQEHLDVVSKKTDEQPVKKPAKRIQSIDFHNNKLVVLADGELSKFDVYELSNPPRLALDLFGVHSHVRLPTQHPGLKSIRQGKHEDKIRIVLDFKEPPLAWTTRRLKSGLTLTLKTKQAAENGKNIKENRSIQNPLETALLDNKNRDTALKPVEKNLPFSPTPLLKDIRFVEAPTGGEIEIVLSDTPKWKVHHPDSQSAVLTIYHTHLSDKLDWDLDVHSHNTPIQMIHALKSGAENQHVQIVVKSDRELKEVVRKTKKGLSWKFVAPKALAQERTMEVMVAADELSKAPVSNGSEAFSKNAFVGKRVSFEFKDIGIHNLLRMIAEVAQKNIVVADDVQGKVTIRLKNVPWDQALELVLRSKGLGKETLGNNIIRVAPLRALEEEARMREERARTMARQEPLVIQLIPVSYANADQMRDRVKEMLTERGSVSVDTRTNTLIVREVTSNMERTRSLVSSLDTQTPQVLIESRIVEANTNYTKEFGIQWGGHSTLSPATGNATGIAFPNTISVGGAAGDIPNAGTSPTPQYAVNLPVAVGAGSGGGLGFVFGSAGGAFQLNLRLSALETQGHVKTISAPKVTTMDNSTARISQGISLPFSQVSASGVNTAFIEARLSLEVTPHITADGSVLMNIRAENNQPDPSNTGANGQPAIQRKEATTQVLVKDAETTVIGGIYVRSGSSNSASVPGLSRIPILGHLFKNHRETEMRQELLIFITPRILNRKPVVQNL